MMFVMSGIIRCFRPGASGLQSLLVHLPYRDSQRAEYLADYLPANAAGLRECLAVWTGCSRRISTISACSALHSGSDTSLFDEPEAQVAAMPQREWERIRRVNRLEKSRMNSMHPPTARRIACPEARHAGAPAVALSPQESAGLAGEPGRYRSVIQRIAVERYPRAMYC